MPVGGMLPTGMSTPPDLLRRKQSKLEGDDILDDAVNVAARLEGIAERGGICISCTAYDHVRGKVAVELADLGEQSLKYIARPVWDYAFIIIRTVKYTVSPALSPAGKRPPPIADTGCEFRYSEESRWLPLPN